MSNTPIKDQLDGIIADLTDVSTDGVTGLYFRNLNRDRSVRVIATRPSSVKANTDIEDNNATIDQLDPNTVGFCLSPRPALDIQCVGATSAVAVEMKAGKKYKIVLDGNVISNNSEAVELRQLLSQYGLEVDYALAPREYYCTEYVPSNSFTVALNTVETNKPLLFKLTNIETNQVIQENITTGSSLFNLGTHGTVFITRELVAIDGKLIMNFDLTQLSSLNGKEVKIELKPLTSDFEAVEVSSITVPDGQEIPFNEELNGTVVFNGSAYTCISVGE